MPRDWVELFSETARIARAEYARGYNAAKSAQGVLAAERKPMRQFAVSVNQPETALEQEAAARYNLEVRRKGGTADDMIPIDNPVLSDQAATDLHPVSEGRTFAVQTELPSGNVGARKARGWWVALAGAVAGGASVAVLAKYG